VIRLITLRIYLIVALLFAAINLPSNMRKHEGKKDFVEILLSQLFVAFMWPIVLLITVAGYMIQAFMIIKAKRLICDSCLVNKVEVDRKKLKVTIRITESKKIRVIPKNSYTEGIMAIVNYIEMEKES